MIETVYAQAAISPAVRLGIYGGQLCLISETSGTSRIVRSHYARIPYSDHDTTFVFAQADASATAADEATAQAHPFTFTVESADVIRIDGERCRRQAGIKKATARY
ncbi:MAG TPA: hypothetical protein VFV73_05120 [Streptosporangiaceae bacterium]|nr:hypothetical protein [Streptosporangiaceae bacterium]